VTEYLKCKLNPIYFIKNYIYIFNQRKGLIKFDMYKKQEEFIRTYLKYHTVIILKSRQTGMSTTL